ncbi:MAG: radical SAM protein [Candidatus Omnitrophota bacterium]|nr:radical SAM protein [Candidatus Omnitrophota bacterium]
MLDIVLVEPVFLNYKNGVKTYRYGLPSIGLCILAAVLRDKGYKCRVIECEPLKKTPEEIASIIAVEKPRYVGITATTSIIFDAANLASLVKKQLPGVKIILGGAHLSAIPKESMERFKDIDIGVIGEGEDTIAELIPALDNRKDLARVLGIIFRDGQGPVITGKREFIQDLDKLPFPAHELLYPAFPQNYVPMYNNFIRFPASSIVSSRGCPAQCTFCDRTIFGNKYRFHSAKYIFDYLRFLKGRYKIKDFLFYDDTFFVSKNRVKELCNLIIGAGEDFKWTCAGRVDSFDEELMRLMKKAGCWQISFGIESGSPKVLDTINKRIDLQQAEDTLSRVKRIGIRTKGLFMIGNPSETRDTIMQTIRYSRRVNIDDFTCSALMPLPGSEVAKTAHLYGDYDGDWEKLNTANVVFVPFGLAKKEIEDLRDEAIKGFYLRPKIIFSYFGFMLKYPSFIGNLMRGMRDFFIFLSKE